MTTTENAPDTEQPPGRNGDERAVRRTVAREFRPRRTVPAVIVAALIALAAILVAIEVISRAVGEPLDLLPVDDLARLGRETQWDDPLTYIVAGLACLLGLLLLFLALWPGRVRAKALTPERPGVVVAVPTHDLERLAAQAAESVDGVDAATARQRRRRISVRANSLLHDPGDLDDRVRQAVSGRLDELSLLEEPRVRVNVRHREE
jgi:hypothetical protein